MKCLSRFKINKTQLEKFQRSSPLGASRGQQRTNPCRTAQGLGKTKGWGPGSLEDKSWFHLARPGARQPFSSIKLFSCEFQPKSDNFPFPSSLLSSGFWVRTWDMVTGRQLRGPLQTQQGTQYQKTLRGAVFRKQNLATVAPYRQKWVS